MPRDQFHGFHTTPPESADIHALAAMEERSVADTLRRIARQEADRRRDEIERFLKAQAKKSGRAA